jgi:hypothetical protein
MTLLQNYCLRPLTFYRFPSIVFILGPFLKLRVSGVPHSIMPADNDLHKAAHKGDLGACKMLIEGTVDEGENAFTVHDLGASDRRPLHRAAGSGHVDICEYFLDIGAEIDAVRNSCHCLGWRHLFVG